MNGTIDNIGSERKRFSLNLFDCFVMLYFLHKMMPLVGYYMPSVMYLGVFAVLMLSSFDVIGRSRKINVLGKMLLLMIVSLFVFIENINTRSISSFPLYLYGEFQTVLFGFIVLSYDNEAREHKNKYLFWFVIACYVITSITTVIGNIRYPLASRILATGDVFSVAFYTAKNIGGFTFVYELVLLIPLIIYMFKNSMINKWLSAGLIVLLGYTIIKTEYTTAFLFFILSLLLFFIPNLTIKKIYVLLGVFVILFVVNVDYFADLLRRLGQNLESEIFSTRFNELALMLEGEDIIDTGNAGSRAELYRRSFNAFVNSDFVGSWSNIGIGGHSFILDTMGRYGVLGIIAIFVVYVTIYSLFVKPYKSEKFYPYLFYVYIMAMVLAFLNPKMYMFIFIVVFPTFAKTMREKSIKQSEDKE